jgi:hypothetical protein
MTEMAQMSDTDQETEETGQSHPAISLPDVYEGWHRVSSDDDLTAVEYWEKTGAASGRDEYRRLAARKLTDKDRYRVTKSRYDQFGFYIPRSRYTLNGRRGSEFSRAVSRLERFMSKRPAAEEFDSRPSFPEQIGAWVVFQRERGSNGNSTRWFFNREEAGHQQDDRHRASAVCILRRSGRDSGFASATYTYDIYYRDAEITPTTIATDVPRTQAYELVEHTLSTLDAPVCDLSDKRDSLTAIDGIGPAKSRDLLLLGIEDRATLREYLETDSAPNYRHADRVDALVTSRIQADLGTAGE